MQKNPSTNGKLTRSPSPSALASSASSPWSWGLAAAPGGAAAAAPPRRLPGTCSPPLPRAGTRHGRRPGRRGGGGRAKKGRDGARGARRHLPSRTSRPPDPAAVATGRARGRPPPSNAEPARTECLPASQKWPRPAQGRGGGLAQRGRRTRGQRGRHGVQAAAPGEDGTTQ